MAAEIKKLQPEAVWTYFYDLTQIPRPTGKAWDAARYVKSVGEKLGLETDMDEVGNVVIRKPATPGYENRPIVTLQGHVDMVPQKNSHVQHDFEKDPIETIIDGDWVRANQTTLGADNGIGSAMALAIMADNTLKHGPLEALFTMDEEVGMVGANGLKPGFIKGDILLNLDSELVDELYIGCAGGIDINVEMGYKEVETPAGDVAVVVSLSGLKGGHSGVDINLGRGNANKMMFRFLKKAVQEFDIELVSMEGGSLRNAIPREAKAIVTLQASEVDDFTGFVKEWESLFNSEYGRVENPIKFVCEKGIDRPSGVIPEEIRDSIINAVEACQNGPITFLVDYPGTVEASSNLASIRLGSGEFIATFLTRSSSETRKEMVASSIASAFEIIGAKVEFDAAYCGWQPNPESHVLSVMRKVFNEMNGRDPEIKVMHAGLETGIIQGVMPNMDMISFGPTILHPHSPDEKVSISTVAKTYDYLIRTLEVI